MQKNVPELIEQVPMGILTFCKKSDAEGINIYLTLFTEFQNSYGNFFYEFWNIFLSIQTTAGDSTTAQFIPL